MAFDKIVTKPIGYKEAAGYLLSLSGARSKLGFINSAGGTFNIGKFKDWIKQGEGFSGIMCWFCIDDNSNFVLAIEPRFNFVYDEDSLESIKPVSEFLFIPPQIFDLSILNGVSLTQIGIEERLRNFKIPMLKPVKRVKNHKVIEWVRKFKSNSPNNEYSSFGFTYFHKNELQGVSPGASQISNFLSDSRINFVRYFFGLKNYEKGEKLRVILVPVGMLGNNLDPIQSRMNDETLLQYSWPPYSSSDSE